MKKYLMHKDTKVAEFMQDNSGDITHIKIFEDKLFPWSAQGPLNSLKRWIMKRKTVTNRPDIAPVIRFYGPLAIKSDSLISLFDCYYLKDEDDRTTWDILNPFGNRNFLKDGLYLSVVKPEKFKAFSENSPNLTLPGRMPVFWHMMDNKLGLICMQAKEDMMRYKIAKDNRITIFKERQYVIISNIIYTFVPVQTNELIERIPFDQLYFQTENKTVSVTKNLINCCRENDIPDWEPFIRQLIRYNTISEEYKIELSDVGVLRDGETLKYIGFDLL